MPGLTAGASGGNRLELERRRSAEITASCGVAAGRTRQRTGLEGCYKMKMALAGHSGAAAGNRLEKVRNLSCRSLAGNRSGSQPLTDHAARGFGTSGLGSDNLAEPLTNSANRPGDGEKRPPVTATGAHIWPAKADAETNGERENARNAGQLGAWGSGYAVNKQRGRRCRE